MCKTASDGDKEFFIERSEEEDGYEEEDGERAGREDKGTDVSVHVCGLFY